MPSRIGPSFSDELEAAELLGLPFSWCESDGRIRVDDPRLTADQKAAILKVYTAHDPTKPAKPTKRDVFKVKVDGLLADETIPLKVREVFRVLRELL